jgi:hypothetical protein
MSVAHSNKGKSIILINLIKKVELKFNSIASLRRELQVSDRTLNR